VRKQEILALRIVPKDLCQPSVFSFELLIGASRFKEDTMYYKKYETSVSCLMYFLSL
jgi:hypothetical protein